MIPGYTPTAKYPVSALPKHVAFTIRPDTEFEKLMADITQERVYVVKLNLYDPVLAENVTVYISSHPYIIDFNISDLPDGSYVTDPVGGAYEVDPANGAYTIDPGV